MRRQTRERSSVFATYRPCSSSNSEYLDVYNEMQHRFACQTTRLTRMTPPLCLRNLFPSSTSLAHDARCSCFQLCLNLGSQWLPRRPYVSRLCAQSLLADLCLVPTSFADLHL